MAPLSDHRAQSGGEAHTSARGREAAVMRLDSGATDSHMRRQGSGVQGERLPHRTQSVLPLSGCATAASPLRPRYLFSPPTFSVAGKSSEVVKLTSGQALVSSVSEHHSERPVQAAKAGCPAGRPAGFSAASPRHHRVFRGMNLGDVDQSTLGGQGGRHQAELTLRSWQDQAPPTNLPVRAEILLSLRLCPPRGWPTEARRGEYKALTRV